jgi:hypothetical protein
VGSKIASVSDSTDSGVLPTTNAFACQVFSNLLSLPSKGVLQLTHRIASLKYLGIVLKGHISTLILKVVNRILYVKILLSVTVKVLSKVIIMKQPRNVCVGTWEDHKTIFVTLLAEIKPSKPI